MADLKEIADNLIKGKASEVKELVKKALDEGMEDVVKAVKETSLDGKVKVMIGGAPVTQSYADEIGADGYAPDAASAVDKAKKLLGQS